MDVMTAPPFGGKRLAMKMTTPIRLLIALSILTLGALAALATGAAPNLILVLILAGVLAVGIAVVPDAQDTIATPIITLPRAAIVQSVIEAISDPVLITRDNRVFVANGRAIALLGAHIPGGDVRLALRHPAALDRLANAEDGAPVYLVGLGQRDMHWEMRLSTLDDGSRVIHLIDRTFRYVAERARVDFVANASHELRTPLAAILGFVETLQDETTGGDVKTRTRFLSVIGAEASRMQRLTEDLMSLSRIEADKHESPSDHVNLSAIAAQAIDEMRDQNGKRPAQLLAQFPPHGPIILGDRTQLVQLIHNLVSNAIKYGRADHPVTIKIVREIGDKAILSVTDEGDGIAPEHLPRLTERFYRVDQARSRSGGGTGLGLAIVKHIAERHRATLNIASEVGVGTTISVCFSVVPAAAVI
jgi:two-component system, OmpR family, phosphate regulon sensor histidine kinase PhoR